MVQDFDAEAFFQAFFDELKAWVAKFFDFTGVGKNDVIVLAIGKTALELRHVFAKLMLANEVASQQ